MTGNVLDSQRLNDTEPNEPIDFRVAESQAGVRPVTGQPERPGLPGRPARSACQVGLPGRINRCY